MKVNGNETPMTLGEKLKSARKNAGLTQENLAKKLIVSRQAVTKWESGKGMPDIDNLRKLSKLLNVSVDYLLDDGEGLDLTITREEIDLDSYNYIRKIRGRLVKKTGKKDMIVREKYPDAEIHYLMGKQILTNGEKVIDNVIGFLFDAPFGIPQFINSVKNTDKDFYLVNKSDKQFFVIVTDEFIECRQLTEKITDKKFQIGDFSFTDCGLIPEPKVE
ncbi:MAG TPA: XRE family transcriptional regulator [Ruminococcus sp.]|nr:XRE family transcriptional regulator [Ruminococcus sp.]